MGFVLGRGVLLGVVWGSIIPGLCLFGGGGSGTAVEDLGVFHSWAPGAAHTYGHMYVCNDVSVYVGRQVAR